MAAIFLINAQGVLLENKCTSSEELSQTIPITVQNTSSTNDTIPSTSNRLGGEKLFISVSQLKIK